MRHHLASITLRMGLAFVFIYAALISFLSPAEWIGYFPDLITALLPDKIVVGAFSIYQIVLAVSILFKHDVTWPALLASLTLIAVIASNVSDPGTAFLNVGLALSALALMFIGKIKA